MSKLTTGEPPPIPCAGRWVNDTNGSDFTCDYEHAGAVDCQECVVNGGGKDPRTGKDATDDEEEPKP